MVLDCGSTIAKYLLCSFNFIIFLVGSVILGAGIWIVADKNSFITLTKFVPADEVKHFTQPAVVQQASYVLIGIGALIFLVSFLGYCGAIRESQCMLTTYGIFLLIILILEIAAGVYAFLNKDKAEKETKIYLKQSIEKYYGQGESTDAVTLLWDQIQTKFQCCGVDDYRDYTSSNYYAKKEEYPVSCCVLEGDPLLLKPLSVSCVKYPTDANSYFNKGCYNSVKDWLMMHMKIVIGVGVGLIILEVVGIFFAFCITKSLNSGK